MSALPEKLKKLILPVNERTLSLIARASCAKVFHSVDRSGLPARGWNERLDQKLMGDLATFTLQSYIHQNLRQGIRCYDDVRSDRFMLRDPGWDLAIHPKEIASSEILAEPWKAPKNTCTISVKSSRVPNSDGTVCRAFERRDFKILAYSPRIIEDLHSDIEVQLYFDLTTSRLDQSIDIETATIRRGSEDPAIALELLNRLNGVHRFKEVTCVGFVTFKRLVAYVEGVPEGDRKFKMPGYGKHFWRAPLSALATSIDRLPEAVAYILSTSDIRPSPITPA